MLIADYGASGLLPPIVLLAALLIDAIVGEYAERLPSMSP